MDRAKYNECMRPYITGTGRSKEERTLAFCIGAKVCSGKASSEEEAAQICQAPKLPKWARQKEEESLSCPERTVRARQTVTQMQQDIREGTTEELKANAARLANDIFTCRNNDPELLAVAEDTLAVVKDICGRQYLKGEGVTARKKLDLVAALL